MRVHICVCVCAQRDRVRTLLRLRNFSTRLVCESLSGNQRLMGTRLCLLTAHFRETEQGKKQNAKCHVPCKVKKEEEKRNRNH